MSSLIPLSDIETAHERLKNRIRRTPFIRARHLITPIEGAGCYIKLENLQVTGSFKARGAMNALLALSGEQRQFGVTTASGGSHGAALAWAASTMGLPATIFLPHNTPHEKRNKLERYGATIHLVGEVWDEANEESLAFAERGAAYIHPFAQDEVMAGQGTIGLEMMKQSSDVNTFIIAIGGGGLISGIASAIKHMKPDARIIGVEPVGAPTLKTSLELGELSSLSAITTKANTLAPKRSAQRNLDIITETVEEIILVDDEEMRQNALWLWQEFGINTELAAAAAMAALRSGKIKRDQDEAVGVLICGAGTAGSDADH